MNEGIAVSSPNASRPALCTKALMISFSGKMMVGSHAARMATQRTRFPSCKIIEESTVVQR